MATTYPTTLDSFVSPTASDKLNGSPNPATVHHVQHANHNDAIMALEAKLGVSFSSSTTSLDFIMTHLLLTQTEHPGAGYRELLPAADPFPTQVIWYTNSGKTIKLVEKNYTYDAQNNVTQILLRIYDATTLNTVLRTITDTVTLSGPFEVSRSRTIV